VSDGEERSRAEPGSKWNCRQSDKRPLTTMGEEDRAIVSRHSFTLRSPSGEKL